MYVLSNTWLVPSVTQPLETVTYRFTDLRTPGTVSLFFSGTGPHLNERGTDSTIVISVSHVVQVTAVDHSLDHSWYIVASYLSKNRPNLDRSHIELASYFHIHSEANM